MLQSQPECKSQTLSRSWPYSSDTEQRATQTRNGEGLFYFQGEIFHFVTFFQVLLAVSAFVYC